MTFYLNNCHKCGHQGESAFQLGSVHLKQVCAKCGCYIQFATKDTFPQIPAIRQAIWTIARGNVEDIEEAMEDKIFTANEIVFDKFKVTSFGQEFTGLKARLQYYKLYLKVIDICSN